MDKDTKMERQRIERSRARIPLAGDHKKKEEGKMPIGTGPDYYDGYNKEEEKIQKRIDELDDWWEDLEFSQKRGILGEDEDNETILKDQQYDEEWDEKTLEEREEIYRDWKDIY